MAGIPFVKIGPGYFHEDWHAGHDRETLGESLIRPLGFLRPHKWKPGPHWTEIPHPFYFAARPITNHELEQDFPDRERVPPTSGNDDPVLRLVDREGRDYAEAYAIWLAYHSGRPIRLPTREELAYARALDLPFTRVKHALLLVFLPKPGKAPAGNGDHR